MSADPMAPFPLRPRRWEARVVSVPMDESINTPIYTFPSVESVFVRVTDADGATGYGYLWCFGERQAKLLVAAVEYLASYVNDCDLALPDLLARARREINFLGYKGVTVFALSAVDMALTDLLCRRLGRSLSSVLGSRRSRIATYWSGLFLNRSLEELGHEVEVAHDAGFRAFKLRVGKPDLREDVARLEAVRARAGADAVVMLDAVQSWDAAQAIAAANAFAPLEPRWLEDPVLHHDYDGLRRTCAESPVPIATGENEYLRQGFAELLRCGVSYLLGDLERIGGVSEWQAVAALTAGTGAVLTPHVYPHAALQLVATVDQAENWIEYLPWWDELMTYDLTVSDGFIDVPDVIGTGIDPDPERLDAFAVTSWCDVATGSARSFASTGTPSARG